MTGISRGMRILFLGKRHYTGKDALLDRFGRIHEIPLHWHATGSRVALHLLDYHGLVAQSDSRDGFAVNSTPIVDPRSFFRLRLLANEFKPDFVVASGDCFIGAVGWRIAQGCGARMIFDVYDDYREFGGYKAFLGLDAYGFLLRRSDLVLYASTAMAAKHDSISPWHLVPNGVDPDVFRPIDQAESRAKVGLVQPNTQWVGYFGGMDPERGATDLVEAVGLLHKQDGRVRLVLCGQSATPAVFDKPWVSYFGNVDHSHIPWFINACDVVALPYRRGPLIDMASSCKIAEYLFCSRPIVATKSPNLMDNFPLQAAQLGEAALCEPGDVANLARAIRYQLENRVTATVPERHTWRSIAADTLEAMKAIPH